MPVIVPLDVCPSPQSHEAVLVSLGSGLVNGAVAVTEVFTKAGLGVAETELTVTGPSFVVITASSAPVTPLAFVIST